MDICCTSKGCPAFNLLHLATLGTGPYSKPAPLGAVADHEVVRDMLPVAARSLPAHFKQRYVVPALLLLMHACQCGNRPEPPPARVTSLKVLPSTVYVIPGAVFVMRARMLDAESGVWPSDPQLTWSVASSLTIVDHGGDSVVLQAANIASNASVPTTLKASLGTLSASASITILAQNEHVLVDSARADYRSGMYPDLMLLDDPSAPKPIDDSLVAFVGVGLLGNLSGGAGEAARLATDQAFYLEAVTWRSTPPDVIDMETAVDDKVSPAIRPTFTVWIATSAGNASTNADADAQWAIRVFQREYTGVHLHPVRKTAGGWGRLTLERGPNLECLSIGPKLQAIGVPVTSPAFSKESLNVVYVDDIMLPPAPPLFVSVSSTYAGYACPWESTVGTVLLISARSRSSGTMTHELGHALGLHEPYTGHTLLANGFAYTNMMWPWESDYTRAPRSTFSLGQAFRIGIDDHSWLRFWTGATRDCDPTAADRSCPPLEKDFP